MPAEPLVAEASKASTLKDIPAHFDADTLAQVIKLRMEQDDAKKGVVLDDLATQYAASQEVLFNALLQAFEFEEVDIVLPPEPEPSEGEAAPPPPPSEIDVEKVWGGRKTLVVVKLALDPEDLVAREKVAHSPDDVPSLHAHTKEPCSCWNSQPVWMLPPYKSC